jgi:hypothetical protein
MTTSRSAKRALALLEANGFLMLQDKALPNLAELVAGRPISGSWWGDANGRAIFKVANEIDDHPDVLATKLVAGKVTFLHRRLWRALIVIGRARELWQTERLSGSARRLLARVDREKRVLAAGAPVKELEKRLLVASREVHTASGKHATELIDWADLARARKLRVGRASVANAKREIESALGSAELPWR